jgi:tRNA threonylcarbamoyladenosine biosynthesis protein TsaB
MLLAIDSATRLLSLALHDGERIASELTWRSANYHTVELAPSVAAMMAQAAITPADLKAVAVAIGPGSFTGLRIGLAVAKGLALAHKLPLAGVPTLDIIAASIGPEDIPLCAIVQAGRGRVCVGRYQWSDGEWRPEGEPAITTLEEVVAQLESPTLFAGEIGATGTKLLRRRRSKAYLLSPAASLRRAGYLAEIGWERFKRGRMDDPATLAPIYLNVL